MEYKCECGKQFEKANSLNAHYSHCAIKRKDSHITTNRGGGGWNKGMTKDTNEGIAKMASTLSKKMKGREGVKHSDEFKKKMSIKRIKFLETHPDCNIKWFLVNNGERDIKVQGEWEKNVAEWLNKNGIKWDRKRICYDGIHHYTPDFWIPDLGFYIEVKGWLSNRDINKMNRIIDYIDIDLRILNKELYRKLENLKIEDLPLWRNWETRCT